jgi:ribosomal-protein-alanine N-acetyltransferase
MFARAGTVDERASVIIKKMSKGVSPVNVIETERLNLRRLSIDDAGFILELLNEPSFIKNIGDKGVRTIADARQYVLNGPVASYQTNGFGLYLVELKESGQAIGICGLVKRDSLADVDIGFAFLPDFWSRGYALESALAVKAYGLDVLKLKRIVAITNPDNEGSIRVLQKIGLKYERMVRLSEDGPAVKLYVSDL